MAPQRTCIGCRREAPVDELVRIVRTRDGGLLVGRTLPGRGAWLCDGSTDCLRTAEKKRVFGRALRGHVRPDAIDALRAQLAERARMVGRLQAGP